MVEKIMIRRRGVLFGLLAAPVAVQAVAEASPALPPVPASTIEPYVEASSFLSYSDYEVLFETSYRTSIPAGVWRMLNRGAPSPAKT